VKPYWADGPLTLYLGDCRNVLPAIGLQADCAVADPPYGETHYAWDTWPDGWPEDVMTVTRSLWCFGSMRMFLRLAPEFRCWQLSQDVVWRKSGGDGELQKVGFVTDRFRRSHELVLHWYHGAWGDVYHQTPREKLHGYRPAPGGPRPTQAQGAGWWGQRGASSYEDDGTRLLGTVLDAPMMRGRNIAPTEKPVALLAPLIEYACPSGGMVLDPFAGSGSTLEAARALGRRAVGIEADERQLEKAVLRLAQEAMDFSEPVQLPASGGAAAVWNEDW
jgi:site-specific DNA-methyltransferase (adenine-specific)